MVVKKEKKRPRGRPRGDPDDLRTERIAVRAHKDLVNELNFLSRHKGVTRSVLIERLLIDLVNDEARTIVVDAIGRYIGGEQSHPPAGPPHRPPVDIWRRARRK
jgi:hypothetical protein